MKYLVLLCSAGSFAIFSIFLFRSSTPHSQQQEPILNAASDDCSKKTGIDKVICLVEAFKGTLKEEQLSLVQLEYSKNDAARWSNLPQQFTRPKRIGLSFGSMTSEQVQSANALIKAVAGATPNEGSDELQQLLNADEYLFANGGNSMFGAAGFFIAFLGKPGKTGTFEIQYGGHHTAFANTYKAGVLTGATPSFRGAEPFTPFTWKGKSNQPMQQEQAAFSEMLAGLSATEQATAKISSTFSDILVGPQKDGAFPATPSGIKCSTLSANEKKLVLNAITTYVSDIDEVDAVKIMRKYKKELDNTYISYSGTTGMTTQNDYVRIDGPSVWIEYSCQHGIAMPGTHPHSVWRDKTNDYGGN
jgi:hypothetical protein